jgi:hypothetical protein
VVCAGRRNRFRRTPCVTPAEWRYIRHAHAVGQVFNAEDVGGKASPAQWKNWSIPAGHSMRCAPSAGRTRKRPMPRNESLAHEAGIGKDNRAIRALQLETEIRTSPERRADRFVVRFRDLKQTGERQYAAGDYSGYKAARAEMGNMAMSLERDPQMESLLANRKRELGISFDSGLGIGRDLALSHGLGLGRGRDIGL